MQRRMQRQCQCHSKERLQWQQWRRRVESTWRSVLRSSRAEQSIVSPTVPPSLPHLPGSAESPASIVCVCVAVDSRARALCCDPAVPAARLLSRDETQRRSMASLLLSAA